MSDHVVIAIIVSLAPTLLASASAWISLANWFRGRSNAEAIQSVHHLVNTRSEQQDQKIERLEAEVVRLKIMEA